MYTLQLTRGRSYAGRGVKASIDRPFVEVDSKETVDFLVATKRFALISASAIDDEKESPLEKMTEAQLNAYAASHDIDISGLKKKADKLYAIQHVIACNAGLENGNAVIGMDIDE